MFRVLLLCAVAYLYTAQNTLNNCNCGIFIEVPDFPLGDVHGPVHDLPNQSGNYTCTIQSENVCRGECSNAFDHWNDNNNLSMTPPGGNMTYGNQFCSRLWRLANGDLGDGVRNEALRAHYRVDNPACDDWEFTDHQSMKNALCCNNDTWCGPPTPAPPTTAATPIKLD